MHLLLAALLVVTCGCGLTKSQQFVPHSRACRNFEKSQELPVPRCQANYWFSTCLHRYSCNDNGEIEFCDCRKWDSNYEYPDCEDLYCSSPKEDMKEANPWSMTTTAKMTTNVIEMLEQDSDLVDDMPWREM